MKNYLLILFFLVFSISIHTAPVSKNEAIQVAYNWLNHQNSQIGSNVEIFIDGTYTHIVDEITIFYVFNFKPEGFVIVAGDDSSYPIIAYNIKGKTSLNRITDNMLSFFKFYEHSIIEINQKLLSNSETRPEWDSIINNEMEIPDNTRTVAPLLSTNWDQGSPWNYFCPSDPNGPGGRVYAGCVAVAMAQVMKYHSYPSQGIGSHSYYHNNYGWQSANFGETSYNWSNMPDNNSTTSTAELLYHLGVSVEMNYGPYGSGAFSDDARDALVQYFGYSGEAQLVLKNNYNNTQWINLLKDQLDNQMPLYYHGYPSSGGGHAFNCDGYDPNNFFHFNWGWSGYYNGYYSINNLNPGSSDFSHWQGAIINVFPVETIIVDELPWEENFSEITAGTIPAGWFRTHSNWAVNNSSNAGGSSPEMRFNWSPSSVDVFKLITPSIFSQGFTSFELSFRHMVDDYSSGGYTLGVAVSEDMENWQNIWTIEPSNNVSSELVELQLSDIVSENFYIAWFFDGNSFNINQWYIDDIFLNVYQEVSLTPPSGLNATPGNGLIELSWTAPEGMRSSENRNNRNLLGYNIYRDGIQHNDSLVANTYFTDYDVQVDNTYNYFVTALYINGESEPSNSVEVFLGMHPENISVTLSSHTVMLDDDFLLYISVDDILEQWSISSYGFELYYDEDMLEFAGIPLIEFSQTLSAFGGMPVYNDIGGQINFGWAHYLPIVTDGDDLLVLKFNAINYGDTQISLGNFIFNAYDIANITPSQIDILAYLYGDVNRDGEVTPLDASIILQYYVGFDPIPEIDPVPWSDLSILIADVDLDGQVLPLDAAFVLQYYVGLVDELPVQSIRDQNGNNNSIEVYYENGFLLFFASEGLIGLGIEVSTEHIKYLGQPTFNCTDWIFSQNISDDFYKIAFARAETSEERKLITKIPVISHDAKQIELLLDLNNNVKQKITINTLQNETETPLRSTLLKKNYPNPFNPETSIVFFLNTCKHVKIEIFNVKGQKIRTLINEEKSEGYHSVIWDGRDDNFRSVGGGIFLYKMQTDNYENIRKMILLK